MEKIIDVNSAEQTADEMEFLELQKMLIDDGLTKVYRHSLVNKFKELIFYYWDNSDNSDEVVVLMKEAIKVMEATEEEILSMYFKDESIEDAEMEEDYLNEETVELP